MPERREEGLSPLSTAWHGALLVDGHPRIRTGTWSSSRGCERSGSRCSRCGEVRAPTSCRAGGPRSA